MSDSFLAAAAGRAVDGITAEGRLMRERPELGGRDTDEHCVNRGLLRCPRCLSRMVSQCGELRQRNGPESALWVPGAKTSAPEEEEVFDWTQHSYGWWWAVGSMDDVDNLGLSRLVRSPLGMLKLAMCVECEYGPFGYQLEDTPTVWLVCDLLHQQDPSLARQTDDFRAPAGVDMGMLEAMLKSGMAIVQFHVSFDEAVLGMQLTDAPDGSGVIVAAFTTMDDGVPLPAEASGRIAVGDRVSRVNGCSVGGLDYAAVLNRIRAAARPLTLHFERKGTGEAPPVSAEQRVRHEDWRDTDGVEDASSVAVPP